VWVRCRWPGPARACYAPLVIRPVARVSILIVLLAAAAVLPVRAAGTRDPAAPGEALSHYLSARLLEERGLDTDALEEYQQALLLDPDQPGIEVRLSALCARLGDARCSLDYAGRALLHDPGNARALWLKGAALFNLEQPAEALAALEAAVAADSGQVDYWRTLAHVAELTDRVPLIARCWRHVVDLDEDDGEAWFQLAAAEARLGRFEVADSLLAEANAVNPMRPGALFLEGWIRESLGRPEEAMDLFRRHLEVHPDDQATRRRLVNLLVDAGRYADAYREAAIVGLAMPDDPEALGVEADLALRLGHAVRAQELLDRLLVADPDDPVRVARVVAVLARRGRGSEAVARAGEWARAHAGDYRGPMLEAQTRAQAGDTAGAAASARRAVEMAPDSLGARFQLATLEQARGRFAAAESVWVEILRRVPRSNRAGLGVAFCREQLGNIDGAVSAARDVLARDPDDASVLNFLGYLYADHARNLADAEDLVRRALAQEPDNGAYVDSMGWVYYRMGRLPEARAQLERAVRLTRGDPVVREHLGDVYKDLRLFELAREQYRQSLAADRGNARVRAKLDGIR